MANVRNFEALVLPHLDAAYNLARWLMRDDHLAEDMVQDACLRAFKYFDALHGDDARLWLLGIVRNNCYTWLENQRKRPEHVVLDDTLLDAMPAQGDRIREDPEVAVDQRRRRSLVDAAIAALAPPFREVVVLRELEGLSYAEIAKVAAIPIGTVMSRLSRAREELRAALNTLRGHDRHE